MNKTLKILLAVLLFAVVLTIATNVSAATTTFDTLAKAVTESDKDNPEVELKDGYYIINADVTITEQIVVGANEELKIVVNEAFTATNGIVVNGKLAMSTDETTAPTVTGNVQVNANGILENSKLALNVVNKGTMYTNVAPTTYTGEGTVYTSGTVTMPSTANDTATVALTLKDEVKYGTTKYDKISVAKKDMDKKMTYKVTKIVPDGEVDSVNKIEAGETYTLTVEAAYDGKVVTTPTVELTTDLVARGVDTNATVDGTDKLKITVVAEKDLEGDKVVLAAQLSGVAESKKDLAAIPVGKEITTPDENKPDENKPDENKPAEDNKPDENKPAEDNKPADENKGQLDPDSPDTGDHIIPATALLAVVVVANVVYFAKMKRN